MVLGDGTEVRRGNTYEQVERIGEVRKRTDVPLQETASRNQWSSMWLCGIMEYKRR
jgi:hypothetical protein